MGNVVLVGGAGITGVLVLFESLLLQAASNSRPQSTTANFPTQRREGAKDLLLFSSARLRLCDPITSDLFFEVILYCGGFSLFLGERFTGDSIFTFNPPAEIDKLTPLRTEGTKRIVFPFDRLTAGWAFHELEPRAWPSISKRCRSFDQYSSFDECDRTFATHGIQAHGDTFSGGADN